jgi:hypothetical protein
LNSLPPPHSRCPFVGCSSLISPSRRLQADMPHLSHYTRVTRGDDERLEALYHRHKWRKDAWTWNKTSNDLGIPGFGPNRCGRFRLFRPTHRAAPLRWKLKAAQGCFDVPSINPLLPRISEMLRRLRYSMAWADFSLIGIAETHQYR